MKRGSAESPANGRAWASEEHDHTVPLLADRSAGLALRVRGGRAHVALIGSVTCGLKSFYSLELGKKSEIRFGTDPIVTRWSKMISLAVLSTVFVLVLAAAIAIVGSLIACCSATLRGIFHKRDGLGSVKGEAPFQPRIYSGD